MKTRKIPVSTELLEQLLAARNALTRSRAKARPETRELDELIVIVSMGLERPPFMRPGRTDQDVLQAATDPAGLDDAERS